MSEPCSACSLTALTCMPVKASRVPKVKLSNTCHMHQPTHIAVALLSLCMCAITSFPYQRWCNKWCNILGKKGCNVQGKKWCNIWTRGDEHARESDMHQPSCNNTRIIHRLDCMLVPAHIRHHVHCIPKTCPKL